MPSTGTRCPSLLVRKLRTSARSPLDHEQGLVGRESCREDLQTTIYSLLLIARRRRKPQTIARKALFMSKALFEDKAVAGSCTLFPFALRAALRSLQEQFPVRLKTYADSRRTFLNSSPPKPDFPLDKPLVSLWSGAASGAACSLPSLGFLKCFRDVSRVYTSWQLCRG